jgi:polycomb protein EED
MDSPRRPLKKLSIPRLPESFKCIGSAKEEHGQAIYSVAFTDDFFHDKDGKTIQCFATCGANVVSVYEIRDDNEEKSRISLRQGYKDPNETEIFYSCAFGGRSVGSAFGYGQINITGQGVSGSKNPRKRSIGSDFANNSKDEVKVDDKSKLYEAMINPDLFDGPQMLCVAGKSAVIKVIDTCRRILYGTLSGHGDEIYDLRFSPRDEWILLSASKDESLRMWNVKNSTCVAIFAGHEGHRDCILSIGWHPGGHQFASGGMDTTVKLWNVGEGTEVYNAIGRSRTVKPKRWDETVDPKEKFLLLYEQSPIFSTDKVHTNYVDVVQFVGDLILSKDTNDMIVLWKPVTKKTNRCSSTKTQQRLPNEVIALREFKLTNCDVWFIRFATDRLSQMLAIGNLTGDIQIFEIGAQLHKKHLAKLTTQYSTAAIRMVSFNNDSRYLVAVSDDASIWLWEAIPSPRKK